MLRSCEKSKQSYVKWSSARIRLLVPFAQQHLLVIFHNPRCLVWTVDAGINSIHAREYFPSISFELLCGSNSVAFSIVQKSLQYFELCGVRNQAVLLRWVFNYAGLSACGDKEGFWIFYFSNCAGLSTCNRPIRITRGWRPWNAMPCNFLCCGIWVITLHYIAEVKVKAAYCSDNQYPEAQAAEWMYVYTVITHRAKHALTDNAHHNFSAKKLVCFSINIQQNWHPRLQTHPHFKCSHFGFKGGR